MPRSVVSSNVPETPPPVFTIGHSTRSFDEFAELLQANGIRCVVDVRRLPGSRRFPQYNAEALSVSLPAIGIDYLHLTALGGRRGRSLAPGETSPNGFWENTSFQRYADYAMGEAFHQGFAELLELASESRCTLMCAEAVWWRCHRRIITDYLLAAGRAVCHILGPGQSKRAEINPAARVVAAGLIYPGPPREETAMPASKVTSKKAAPVKAASQPRNRTRTYAVGDHVSWNCEAGRVRGTITKVHTCDTDYKGHTHRASADAPQYEIKSEKTDHIAMHMGGALRKLATKAAKV